MGAPAHPEGTGKFLRQSAVMVLRAETPQQPHTKGCFKMAALPASSHIGKRTRAILIDDAFEFGGDFINRLIPGNTFKFVAHLL